MDKRLFDMAHERVPKINPRIAEGYAVRPLKMIEGYIDRIIRTAAVDFPPGLKYERCVRCTPQEEYNEVLRRLSKQQNNSNRSTHELAHSDLYMVKYYFSFEGEELEPRPIYLPYLGPAGTITLRGSSFAVVPVAADNGLSVGVDNIFFACTRLKLTFKRLKNVHHFMRNGERESPYVIHSRIHQGKPPAGVKPEVQGETTIPHYMFAKYGVTETFRRFLNAEVVIGDPMKINAETYPTDEWMICSSAMFKPSGVKDNNYVASNIRLAIRKKDYSHTATGLIGGFFYVVDHFPDRIMPEYVDETRIWMVLLGQLLFGESKGQGKIAEEMMAHMKSLDGYMDEEARVELHGAGIAVTDIYEFFMHIIQTFSYRLTQSSSDISSLYGKRLKVLRYVAKDITEAVVNFMFKVNSPKKKALTKNDINKYLRDHLKPMLIMGLNKNHMEVSSVSTPGDNMYFKITSAMALQTDSAGSKSKRGSSPNDPSKILHVSMAEVGSYSTMNKSDATGSRKLNPYVHTDDNDTIVRDPSKADLLDGVQRLIQRRN